MNEISSFFIFLIGLTAKIHLINSLSRKIYINKIISNNQLAKNIVML